MSDAMRDPLVGLSEALAARVAAAAGLVAGIDGGRGRRRSGILWRRDVVIASQQVFAKLDQAEIVLADGRRFAAKPAGRDPGTNLLALRLEGDAEAGLPAAAEPQLGGLALALAAGRDGRPTVRLGVVGSLGPAWHSLAGGRIDRRIALDLTLARSEEGGPVLDADGRLLGMSTGGPGGRALVIPAVTIERVIDPLLAAGHIARGWLGVALHPVMLPEAARAADGQGGQDRGLMVMQVAAQGPAAAAGVLAGDILLAVDGAPATRPAEIARQLGPDSVGRQVELRFLRTGAVRTAAATVTARPAE